MPRDRFPRSILVTSSRGGHEDATRKTASVEFKLNAIIQDVFAFINANNACRSAHAENLYATSFSDRW